MAHVMTHRETQRLHICASYGWSTFHLILKFQKRKRSKITDGKDCPHLIRFASLTVMVTRVSVQQVEFAQTQLTLMIALSQKSIRNINRIDETFLEMKN